MTWTVLERHLSGTGPLWPDSLFGHLAATAVPGVEEWREGRYRRTLALPGGAGILALTPGPGPIAATLHLTDPGDEQAALRIARGILDLDRDIAPVERHLCDDPALAPLVAAAPGRRVPGLPGLGEAVARAVLGQQVSTAAARTHAGRLALALGDPVEDPVGGLTRLFPAAAALAGAPDALLRLPARRRASLRAAAEWAHERGPAAGALVAPSTEGLLAIPGIGPWTEATVAMRALHDADAWVPGDLGLLAAARQLGLADSARALTARAERWRPYRVYAVQHLWGVLAHPINTLPDG